jgi:hypothetical protein
MIEQLRRVLALDLDEVDVRGGLAASVAVLVAIVFVAVFGDVGVTAGLAALFVIAADQPGPVRQRWIGVLVVTVVGSSIAFVAVWAGIEHIWVATLLTFTVTAVATLTAGFGHVVAMRGLVLSMWAVLALSFAGAEESALALATAFLVGGAIAAVILWVEARGSSGSSVEAEAEAAAHSLEELIRSPLGWFALLRAGAVALATALGIALFPDHAIWPALTVLLVMRPKAGEALTAGVLRTVGTLGGVVAAEAVVYLAGGAGAVLFAAFMIAAFAMVALKRVNYAVFVLFLTAAIILSEALLGENTEAAATQRLVATVLGAAIAFIGIGLGRAILRRQKGDTIPSAHA